MEYLTLIMSWMGSMPDWIAAITTVVTAATAVTMLTPTTADDKAINMLLKVLNLFAGNIIKNKNADDA